MINGSTARYDTGMHDQEPRWLTADQQRVWRDWLRVVAWSSEQLNADLRPHNLDLNEYEVLVVLSEAPEHSMRMSQVAEGSNQSRSRLTHTIGRMERRGLVRRETASDDRRGVIATLTTEGFEALKQAAPAHVESVRRILIDPIADEDLMAIGRGLEAVLANMECPEPDPE